MRNMLFRQLEVNPKKCWNQHCVMPNYHLSKITQLGIMGIFFS